MDDKELSWRLYQNERDFIRHHENQRSNASSILVAISSGLVVAVGSDLVDGWFRVAISIVLTLIGVFGAIFSGKLYELIQMHAARSYCYLDFLDQSSSEININEVKKRVAISQRKNYPVFSKISLNKIWFRFHILVSIFGALITAISIGDIFGWLS